MFLAAAGAFLCKQQMFSWDFMTCVKLGQFFPAAVAAVLACRAALSRVFAPLRGVAPGNNRGNNSNRSNNSNNTNNSNNSNDSNNSLVEVFPAAAGVFFFGTNDVPGISWHFFLQNPVWSVL